MPEQTKFKPQDTTGLTEAIAEDGFATAEAVFSVADVIRLVAACEQSLQGATVRRRQGAVFGVRDALNTIPFLEPLAIEPPLSTLARHILGDGARPVRAIVFDKAPDANWKVPWHQDMTIAVKERKDVPGFSAWTTKAGIPHVEAPASLLERMVTLRLHLDDCDTDNGALMVLPGSHRHGKLGPGERASLTDTAEPVTCIACAGDVLLMRPLLLHRSSPARRPTHRRVVHIEYVADALPGGLDWRD